MQPPGGPAGPCRGGSPRVPSVGPLAAAVASDGRVCAGAGMACVLLNAPSAVVFASQQLARAERPSCFTAPTTHRMIPRTKAEGSLPKPGGSHPAAEKARGMGHIDDVL